jgi:hypothetical protein
MSIALGRMKPFRARSMLFGLVGSVVAGLGVALPTTWADWRLNPAGIFRSESGGTDWSIVLETALSWFVPVAIPVFLVVAGIHHWLSNRHES